MQHLKRIIRSSVRFDMKFEVLFTKILEKNDFSEIRLKNLVGFWQTWANFWAVIQDMLKMTEQPFSLYHYRKRQEFLEPGGSCKKRQPISQRKVGFHPASIRVKNMPHF